MQNQILTRVRGLITGSLFRHIWELFQCISVSVRSLLKSAFPIKNISVLEQFVQQYQQNVRLSGGHCPSRRSQLSSPSQKTLYNKYISTANGSVQRSHSVQVHMFDRGAFLQQQLHQFRIALKQNQRLKST